MSDILSHVAGVAVVVVVVAAVAFFIIGTIVSILRSGTTGGMKFVWLVLVCMTPVLGSLLWFVIGRPHARREQNEA